MGMRWSWSWGLSMHSPMTSHPVVAQRNRGTMPGRDQWRMAPWEVLSINNPRRMLGQGNRSHCLLVSCYVDQLEHKRYTLHQLASQACFLSLRRPPSLLMKALFAASLQGNPLDFLTSESSFLENWVFSCWDWKSQEMQKCNQKHWQLAHLSNPTRLWISGNMRKAPSPTGR